jgi:hypothetical protein
MKALMIGLIASFCLLQTVAYADCTPDKNVLCIMSVSWNSVSGNPDVTALIYQGIQVDTSYNPTQPPPARILYIDKDTSQLVLKNTTNNQILVVGKLTLPLGSDLNRAFNRNVDIDPLYTISVSNKDGGEAPTYYQNEVSPFPYCEITTNSVVINTFDFMFETRQLAEFQSKELTPISTKGHLGHCPK